MGIERRWRKVDSRVVYQNPWIRIIEDSVIRPDGEPSIYSYLEKPSGAFVIAQEEDGSIYLLHQFRYPTGSVITELPCGIIEDSSDLLKEARRELYEETRIGAGKIEEIGQFYVAAGHETTIARVFLATDLDTSKLGTGDQEGDESIQEIIKVSKEKLMEMIEKGQVNCGISLAAMMLAFARSQAQK